MGWDMKDKTESTNGRLDRETHTGEGRGGASAAESATCRLTPLPLQIQPLSRAGDLPGPGGPGGRDVAGEREELGGGRPERGGGSSCRLLLGDGQADSSGVGPAAGLTASSS